MNDEALVALYLGLHDLFLKTNQGSEIGEYYRKMIHKVRVKIEARLDQPEGEDGYGRPLA